ncbi:GNAT family N-acetyltransferase [Methylobacterium currus]|nr:GNAT family N-acetyltransferase [Methylobacterium currus]
MLGPTLETPRLILRPPSADDLEPWLAMMGDAEANCFLGGPKPRPVAWRSLATHCGAWTLQGFGNFSIIEKASGLWVGRAGPWQPEGWPGREIGWSLARASWGKGYATEAARACLDWTFDRLGWRKVVRIIDPANTASIAVATRLGSTRIGPGSLPAPFEPDGVDVYGQSLARRT